MFIHRKSLDTAVRCLAVVSSAIVIGICNGYAAGTPSHMSIPLGIMMEHNFYNQPGIHISFSDDRILNTHPRLSFSYTTSRIGTLWKNTLAKDNYLLTAGWYFRPERVIEPFIRADFGFSHFNKEDDIIFKELDNNAMILAIKFGSEFCSLDKLIRPWFDVGYSILSSSTVWPFVFSIGIDYDISKGLFK